MRVLPSGGASGKENFEAMFHLAGLVCCLLLHSSMGWKTWGGGCQGIAAQNRTVWIFRLLGFCGIMGSAHPSCPACGERHNCPGPGRVPVC